MPVFFWEPDGVFPITPPVMIASNCERLEIFVNGAHVTTGLPAAKRSPFGNLPYPPFLVRFPAWAPHSTPELMIEGYVGDQQVTELRMSSDPAGDTLALGLTTRTSWRMARTLPGRYSARWTSTATCAGIRLGK